VVIEPARARRACCSCPTFGLTETTIYHWLEQDSVDRGETPVVSTDQQLAQRGILRG
jgi:hypothetical protein